MTKRAKLTLGNKPVEGKEQVEPEHEKPPRSSAPEKDAPKTKTAVHQKAAPQKPAKTESTIGKTLLYGWLTIVSLIIFKRKIF